MNTADFNAIYSLSIRAVEALELIADSLEKITEEKQLLKLEITKPVVVEKSWKDN